MGYRVLSGILAVVCAVLAVRELTRPAPEFEPRDPWEAPAGAPVPRVVPVEGGGASPMPETPSDAAGGEPGTASDEPVLDLAIRLLTGPASRRRRQASADQLRPHADEVIPILEDWLRRREEIRRRGIELYGVPWAYAELAGPRALPLFEELVKEDADHWHNTHLEALTRIDDPQAVVALRRHHDRLRQNEAHVKADYLWVGAPGFRDLLKEWAESPPANLPELRDRCLWEWFRVGTMEDREKAWSVLEERSRLRILGGNAAWNWPSPWPERYEAAVRAELAAEESLTRYRGLFHVLSGAEKSSPDLVAEAERILSREIESAEARRGDVRPTLEELVALRERREAWQQERAAAQRKRELLTPR